MNALLQVAIIVGQLGIGVTSDAIYDYLKSKFAGRTEITTTELQVALNDYLIIHGVTADASTIMTVLAEKGVISVTQSQLYAPDQLIVGAGPGAAFSVGDQTTTRTDNTAIKAGSGAFMSGSNAAVRQNPDGSISFHVGGDGNVTFSTPKQPGRIAA